MKTSLTKLSSSILFFSLSIQVWAAPMAQVVAIKGTAFVISAEGKTQELKLNQHIDDKSEVMVEEGASVSLNDYYDSTYHLVGGSHMKFYNRSVQLKRGKSWIQSSGKTHKLGLTTANGKVIFGKSEFITFFDQANSKTQVLVVNGEVEVSNILNQDMKETVTAGTFTILDPEIENGVPRVPTKVGVNSLNAALAEFTKTPDKIETTAARSIASVEDKQDSSSFKKAGPQLPKGEIIYITKSRMPASVRPGLAHSYFKKVTSKKAVTNEVPIKIYGQNSVQQKLESSPRKPASFQKQTKEEKVPTKVAHEVEGDIEFNSSLKKQMEEQPKHPKPLQGLIEELQSY